MASPTDDYTPWREPDTQIVELLDKLGINGFQFPGGTDKATLHNYTGIYAYLLEEKRPVDCKLLEIGARQGGSALLWQRYMQRVDIHLVDIKDGINRRIREKLDKNLVTFYEMDAYSETALRTLDENKYDIIIDDGSHAPDDILFVAKHYYHLLEPGGVMILEDIPDDSLLKKLAGLFSKEEQKGIRVFDVRESGRWDDLVWTITKET